MTNWQNFGGLWINKPNISAMKVQSSDPDPSGNEWYIWYTFNGAEWIQDTTHSYATAPDAQTALNAFGTSLG